MIFAQSHSPCASVGMICNSTAESSFAIRRQPLTQPFFQAARQRARRCGGLWGSGLPRPALRSGAGQKALGPGAACSSASLGVSFRLAASQVPRPMTGSRKQGVLSCLFLRAESALRSRRRWAQPRPTPEVEPRGPTPAN